MDLDPGTTKHNDYHSEYFIMVDFCNSVMFIKVVKQDKFEKSAG